MMTLRQRYRFFSKLGLLLEAGVTLDRAVGLLAKRAESAGESELLSAIERQIGQGQKLSEIMRQTPDAFTALETEMVAVAEQANSLPAAVSQLGNSRELDYRIALKFHGENVYYTILVILGVAFYLYFTWLFFIRHSPSLNLAILFEIFSKEEMKKIWGVQFLATGTLAIVVALYWTVAKFAPGVLDWLRLVFPSLNRRLALADQAAFLKAMALGLKAGLQVPRSLGLAADSIRNLALKRALMERAALAKEGIGISQTLDKVRGLPPSLSSLLALSEKTGSSPAAVFSESSRQCEELLESSHNGLFRLLIMALLILSLFPVIVFVMESLGIYKGIFGAS